MALAIPSIIMAAAGLFLVSQVSGRRRNGSPGRPEGPAARPTRIINTRPTTIVPQRPGALGPTARPRRIPGTIPMTSRVSPGITRSALQRRRAERADTLAARARTRRIRTTTRTPTDFTRITGSRGQAVGSVSLESLASRRLINAARAEPLAFRIALERDLLFSEQ